MRQLGSKPQRTERLAIFGSSFAMPCFFLCRMTWPTSTSYLVVESSLVVSEDFEYWLWLVVWNINFIFPYIRNVIIPTDVHSIIFQRGRLNHQPGFIISVLIASNKHLDTTKHCTLQRSEQLMRRKGRPRLGPPVGIKSRSRCAWHHRDAGHQMSSVIAWKSAVGAGLFFGGLKGGHVLMVSDLILKTIWKMMKPFSKMDGKP